MTAIGRYAAWVGDKNATTLVSRRAAFGHLAAWSSAALLPSWQSAALVSRRPSWNFSRVSPTWMPLEIAAGDTLIVPARVNGKSVQAILDTGSGASIVNASRAVSLGLGEGEARTISGLSAKAPVQLIRNVEVALAQVSRKLPFIVTGDLRAIEAALGRSVDLLLGADMFAGHCLALDFGQSRFALAASGSFTGGEGWTAIGLSHGTKQELLVSASIAGAAPVPLMLDTGSSAALMLSSSYLQSRGLLDRIPTSTAALGGIEGVRTVTLFTLDRLKIGGLEVASIPSLGMPSWLSISSVGNIGLPLLAQFNTVIDASAERLWLRPLATRQRRPMLKDRSGLGLAASGDALIVVHVSPGSPASMGDWIVGDRIVRVNGHAVGPEYAGRTLRSWRYGSTGKRVTLTLATGQIREIRLQDFY